MFALSVRGKHFFIGLMLRSLISLERPQREETSRGVELSLQCKLNGFGSASPRDFSNDYEIFGDTTKENSRQNLELFSQAKVKRIRKKKTTTPKRVKQFSSSANER